MDVRIGLVYSQQPLELELPDDADIEAIKAELAKVLTDDEHVAWLTDKKGTQVALVGGKVTFVALGTGGDKGKIGFGS